MNSLKTGFKTFFALIFTICFLPAFCSLLLCLVLYRKCVDLILSKKIGEKYGGLLTGGDPLFTINTKISKTTVNLLFMVSYPKKDFYSVVKNILRKRVFDDPGRLIKFTGVLEHAYGYSYVLKDKYSIDECVRELEEELTGERDLQEVLNKYGNLPLPKNHTAFWEILVCKNSIKWKNFEDCYPILFRFHHSMSDGTNVLRTLSKLFTDEPLIIQKEQIVVNWRISKLVSAIKQFLFGLYIIIKLPSYILLDIILKKVDSNPFTDKILSGKMMLSWKIEDGDIVAKIKEIKKKKKTTFTDVLATAISASCEQYFEKKLLGVPENFTIGFPINCNRPDQKALLLTNDFAALLFQIPIRWGAKPLTEKLMEIKRRRKIFMNNNVIAANYWLFTILPTYLPRSILKSFSNVLPYTLAFSNVPGGPSVNIFRGRLVDIISCAVHYSSSGITLVLLTYGDGKLQIGLSVDKSLINSLDEGNDILDGIGGNVDVLYQELSNKFK